MKGYRSVDGDVATQTRKALAVGKSHGRYKWVDGRSIRSVCVCVCAWMCARECACVYVRMCVCARVCMCGDKVALLESRGNELGKGRGGNGGAGPLPKKVFVRTAVRGGSIVKAGNCGGRRQGRS